MYTYEWHVYVRWTFEIFSDNGGAAWVCMCLGVTYVGWWQVSWIILCICPFIHLCKHACMQHQHLKTHDTVIHSTQGKRFKSWRWNDRHDEGSRTRTHSHKSMQPSKCRSSVGAHGWAWTNRFEHCMCVTNSISNLKHTAITLHTYSQHCKLCFTMAIWRYWYAEK